MDVSSGTKRNYCRSVKRCLRWAKQQGYIDRNPVADMEMPGVQDIVREMKDSGVSTPDQLLGACLDHLGYVELSEETQAQMEESIKAGGNLDWSNESATAQRIGETMALIGATTEYQFG